MIENEVVLLVWILLICARTTHDVYVCSGMIDVHDVIYYFHILSWLFIACFIRVWPLIILIVLAVMILVVGSYGAHILLLDASWRVFVCVVVSLVSFHVYFFIQFYSVDVLIDWVTSSFAVLSGLVRASSCPVVCTSLPHHVLRERPGAQSTYRHCVIEVIPSRLMSLFLSVCVVSLATCKLHVLRAAKPLYLFLVIL